MVMIWMKAVVVEIARRMDFCYIMEAVLLLDYFLLINDLYALLYLNWMVNKGASQVAQW